MEVDSISPADARSIAQKVKQRVLVCSSRGISHRQRHLMGDLMTMLPHGKKESKLDQKKNLGSLNEIAELTNCNKVLYLESRRGTDLYMWLSHAPNGPSIKFEVVNIHTMDELNMTGNHLKFSRAILSFDATFEETPQTRIMKELLAQTFNTPRGHRRSKPFFDHVMSFSYSDDRVWVRNYQITETSPAGTVTKANSTSTEVALNEVGPRFVLNPIKLFQGSFGGIGLWENERYLTPAAVRRAERAEVGDKHASKEEKKVERVERSKASEMPKDPLASVFRD
ncbi:Brix domain-containing protein [Blastocladiella britannica]|nr:Brix domain-containing protein [Blastocladiella britannica]